MIYKVIGLMSGSSLDGLDIAYVQLEEVRGKWDFTILQAACVPYDDAWTQMLRTAIQLDTAAFLRLHTAYGRYLGHAVSAFMAQHDLEHKVHFIASHGHTAFHDPGNNTTFQLGDGAAITAITGLPVISDLRAIDVALGGQGAPIVPIGDRLLFGSYDYLLNIGGIANVTIQAGGASMAFDICPANQPLNALAQRIGKQMDMGGGHARSGRLLPEVMDILESAAFYGQQPPRSLSNEAAMGIAAAAVTSSGHDVYDLLHTVTVHIAGRVVEAIRQYGGGTQAARMLVTGGGALNTFLVEQLQSGLEPYNVSVVVPDISVVQYKEALVMALIGALRWREEANVLASATGAKRNSIGGALWLPGDV